MAETLVGRILLDGAIVALILSSLTEVYVDVSGREVPAFLPSRLAALPPSEPATALSLAGVGLLALGVVLELAVAGEVPSGRLLVGFIALVSFLFAGGFVVSDGDDAAAEADG